AGLGVATGRAPGRGGGVERPVVQPHDAVDADPHAVVDVLGEGELAVGVEDLAGVDPRLVAVPQPGRAGGAGGLPEPREQAGDAPGVRGGRVDVAGVGEPLGQTGELGRAAGDVGVDDQVVGAGEPRVDGDRPVPGRAQAQVAADHG